METSPNVGVFWRCGRKINICYENIISERKTICIAWKWQGEKEVHSLQWDKNQDDKKMLQEFIPILNSADESVAHFGDSYDLPWIKARCLHHGIPTLPKYKTIDTLKWARGHFLLNSNKLDYIAQFLGIGSKIRTDFDLWKKVLLDKDEKALAYMVKYNKEDVRLLEKVYERISMNVPHKTHAGVMKGLPKWTCPNDGSDNVRTSKTNITANGTVQYQMQCKCGTYFTISGSVHDAYVLAKGKK